MENKAHALAAGIFVLVMGALLAGLAYWLTRQASAERDVVLVTQDAITGLQAQASVQFRGLKVGRVEDIDLDPASPGQIRIRLSVRADTPITPATYATLGYQGLTGIAFVQLELDPQQAASAPSGDDLRTGQSPPTIPLRAGWMARWTQQGERLLGQLTEAAERANQLLAPDNQLALRRSVDALAQAAVAVPPALERVERSFAVMSASASTVGASADRVRLAADDYAALAGRLQAAGGTLDQLQHSLAVIAATTQSAQQGGLPRANRALDEAGQTARVLRRTARQFDEQPQSLVFGLPLGAPGPGEPGFVSPATPR